MNDLEKLKVEIKKLVAQGKNRTELFSILNKQIYTDFPSLKSMDVALMVGKAITNSVRQNFGLYHYLLLSVTGLYMMFMIYVGFINYQSDDFSIISLILTPSISIIFFMFLLFWRVRIYTWLVFIEILCLLRNFIILISNGNPDSLLFFIVTILSFASIIILVLAIYLNRKIGSSPKESKVWITDSTGKKKLILKLEFPEDIISGNTDDILDQK